MTTASNHLDRVAAVSAVPSTPARIRAPIRNQLTTPAVEHWTPVAIPSHIPLDFVIDEELRTRHTSGLNETQSRSLVADLTSGSSGLAAVCCYFNPCHYRSRYRTYGQFAARIHAAKVPLLTVELAIKDDPFELDDYPNVLRVRAADVLWHKERLLNIGIERLVEQGFEKIAWLDADIVFRNDDWPMKVSRTLDTHPACQVFRTVFRQRERGNTFQAIPSSAWDAAVRHSFRNSLVCPGFGWAATAETLRQVLLYDRSILGSGDTLMYLASYCWPLQRDWERSVKDIGSIRQLSNAMWRDYLSWASRWGAIVRGCLGFADCEIVALYHGTIANRRYGTRDDILMNHEFDPNHDLAYDRNQCLRWNSDKPLLHEEVRSYFITRAEDL